MSKFSIEDGWEQLACMKAVGSMGGVLSGSDLRVAPGWKRGRVSWEKREPKASYSAFVDPQHQQELESHT